MGCRTEWEGKVERSPTWGNAGRGIFGGGGTRGTLGAGVLILDVFWEHFRRHWETLWQPWESRGTPLSPFFGPVGAILQPRGRIRGTTRKRPAFWLLGGVKK